MALFSGRGGMGGPLDLDSHDNYTHSTATQPAC